MACSFDGTDRGDFTQEPAIRKGAISSHIGNVSSCDACVIAISLLGLWAGLLRFAFLRTARATVDRSIDGGTGSRGDAHNAIFRHRGTTGSAFDDTTQEMQSLPCLSVSYIPNGRPFHCALS